MASWFKKKSTVFSSKHKLSKATSLPAPATPTPPPVEHYETRIFWDTENISPADHLLVDFARIVKKLVGDEAQANGHRLRMGKIVARGNITKLSRGMTENRTLLDEVDLGHAFDTKDGAADHVIMGLITDFMRENANNGKTPNGYVMLISSDRDYAPVLASANKSFTVFVVCKRQNSTVTLQNKASIGANGKPLCFFVEDLLLEDAVANVDEEDDEVENLLTNGQNGGDKQVSRSEGTTPVRGILRQDGVQRVGASPSGRRPRRVSMDGRRRRARGQRQCYHWDNPRHDHEDCGFYHPTAECRFAKLGQCRHGADKCEYAHPFCGRHCECGNFIDRQLNHIPPPRR